jgi:hypothetical protein
VSCSSSTVGRSSSHLPDMHPPMMMVPVFVGFIQLRMLRHIADDSMRVTGGCEQTVRPSAVFGATS